MKNTLNAIKLSFSYPMIIFIVFSCSPPSKKNLNSFVSLAENDVSLSVNKAPPIETNNPEPSSLPLKEVANRLGCLNLDEVTFMSAYKNSVDNLTIQNPNITPSERWNEGRLEIIRALKSSSKTEKDAEGIETDVSEFLQAKQLRNQTCLKDGKIWAHLFFLTKAAKLISEGSEDCLRISPARVGQFSARLVCENKNISAQLTLGGVQLSPQCGQAHRAACQEIMQNQLNAAPGCTPTEKIQFAQNSCQISGQMN